MNKNTNNLPDEFSWFNLKNYEVMDDAGIQEWAYAVSCRHFLVNILSLDANTYLDGEFIKSFDLLFERSQGLGRKIDTNLDRMKSVKPENAFAELCCKSVSPTTIGWLSAVCNDIHNDERISPISDYLMNGVSSRDEDITREIEKYEDVPIDIFYEDTGIEYLAKCSGTALFSVDLEASTDVLVDHFRESVEKLKQVKGLKTVKKFTSSDFSRWRKNRSLEYIDLICYAKRKQIKLTDQQLGLALYPDEYHIALNERIRKTVRPMAKHLVSDFTAMAIMSQAESRQNFY